MTPEIWTRERYPASVGDWFMDSGRRIRWESTLATPFSTARRFPRRLGPPLRAIERLGSKL